MLQNDSIVSQNQTFARTAFLPYIVTFPDICRNISRSGITVGSRSLKNVDQEHLLNEYNADTLIL